MLINDLNFEKSLSPSISRHSINNLSILKIQSSLCEAAISLHGGHLLQFKPAGEKDIIWLSDKAIYSPEKAIRGGIPVCWPWFGTIGSPSHGFARISPWQLMNWQESEEAVVITLGLSASEQTKAIWPHEFSATLTFRLSASLKTTLTVTNTGATPWRWSGALHSYFQIAEATETSITGAGKDYIDSLQSVDKCKSTGDLLINQSIDRVYTTPDESIIIHDKENQRRLSIRNTGSNAAVIWNPWDEISKGMADMDDDGYKTMVCVESTNFADNLESGTLLSPEETHQLTTEISILPQ
ncbi:D-hexose-6-phosphate mutarotase [uncultured Endozoicomonas sp.]|uniref:D-hexose-6-phosphate mutarotase n=1 Tax=uncultured Endozoicomonas sp. TaxID=432652 RepID=UPI00263333A0|nr:D-hexose-6-phosphate mutarotase [uncultured Endozoicomonas sp.]